MQPTSPSPRSGGGAHARRVRRLASAAFAVSLLPLLCALYFLALRGPLAEGGVLSQAVLGVAGAFWLVAILLARGGGGNLRLVVVGAILLRLFGLVAAPELSDDVYRYVWEGELVTRAQSPYALPPDAPELAGLRAELPLVYESMNHPDVSACYPPTTQAAAAGVVALAGACGDEDGLGAVYGMRLFFALCDLLVLWPLVLLLRRRSLPDGLAVAWGWSPLVALEFSASGHHDSLGILLLLAALATLAAVPAAGRRVLPGLREAGGYLLLAAATLVKLLPLLALPFVARGRGFCVRALLFLLLSALAFTPLVWLAGGWQGLFEGLGQYGLRWEHKSLVYQYVEAGYAAVLPEAWASKDPRVWGRGTIGVLVLCVLAWQWFRRRDAVSATGAMVATFLLLTPTLHPWYITWVLPFVALRPRASWAWLAAGAFLLYWPGGAQGGLLGEYVSRDSAVVAQLGLALVFFPLLAVEVVGLLRAREPR